MLYSVLLSLDRWENSSRLGLHSEMNKQNMEDFTLFQEKNKTVVHLTHIEWNTDFGSNGLMPARSGVE